MPVVRTAYSDLEDGEIDAESPLIETVMFRLRDNWNSALCSSDGTGPDTSGNNRVRCPERLKTDGPEAANQLLSSDGAGGFNLSPAVGFINFFNAANAIDGTSQYILSVDTIKCDISLSLYVNDGGDNYSFLSGTYDYATKRLALAVDNATHISIILTTSYQTIRTLAGGTLQARFGNTANALDFINNDGTASDSSHSSAVGALS